MSFGIHLRNELQRRQRINRLYSLRSFADSLKTNHSTLSQLLRGRRRITRRIIRELGPRLGLTASAIAECCIIEDEASILAALDDARFKPNSRWLAVHLNIPLDDINVALQRLLLRRSLRMTSTKSWEHARSHG